MNAHTAIPDLAVAPHNIAAEQELLGAILLNNEAYHAIADRLTVDDFFEPIHARIFEVCGELIRADKKATPVTLKSFLPADLDIEGLPLGIYLARLAAQGIPLNATAIAAIIRDCARRRSAIEIAQDLIAKAYHPDPVRSANDLIASAIGDLEKASGDSVKELTAVSINEAVAIAVDSIAKAYQRDGQISGITWGLADLDAKTLGLHRGEVTILGGRPGMGKSALAVAIALAASETLHGVGILSLEMSAESLALRALAEGVARKAYRPVSYHQMRAGKFDETDFEHITAAAVAVGKLPIVIDEQPLVTSAQLTTKIRRLRKWLKKAGSDLELLIVDYLQLMSPGDRYKGQRVQEVTEISAALKRLARQENIAVLALSQLSRKVEERADKHPMLADLRESGSIEQDADTVIFLYREAYYHEQSRPPESDREKFGDWLAAGEKVSNKLECIVSKQRHGPTGMVEVYFDPATNSVRDLARIA